MNWEEGKKYEKKDFRKLYEDLVKSDWFKKAYNNKSLGECPLDFPELSENESEDERVRKSLIRFLTDIKEISESGRTTWAVREEDAEMCKSFLAYLEKQKLAEWSEKDKAMLNNIIWGIHLKSIIKPLYEMDDRSKYKKYEDFLKALPERFNLQPKQEWSDEDESNATFILESLDGLLRYCKKNKEGAHQSKQIKEAQEWIKTRLKSIKPQLETNGEEYIRNLENLESIVYYTKSLPDDTRTKLGNFLRSLRTRKTCGVDEFSLTLRNCLSTDSELTDEQADTFARAYGEDLYKVALGEISTGLDKWDIEEYRNEKFMGE